MRRRYAYLLGAWTVGVLAACSDDERPAPHPMPTETESEGTSAAPSEGSIAGSDGTRESSAALDDAGATYSVSCIDGGSDEARCTPDNGPAQLQLALDDIVQADLVQLGALGMGVTVQFPDGRRFESAAGPSGPADSAATYDVASTKQVIGSVTKLFTTVLAVQLIEAGELELERTVDEWFEFEDAKDITIRMLLQHTSGLADCLALMPEEQAAQVWTPTQLLALAVDAERVSDKGGVAFYSNTNFAALAMIVEAVTGKSWQTNVMERIAQPLGLSDVFYAGDAEGAEHLVDGWVHTEDGWVGALQFTDPSVGWGYGALTATNRDLARFGRALFDGDLFASDETLSKVLDFTAEMDPSVLAEGEPPQTVGLGVIRYHLDGFVLDGHLGHILGYHAAILRDPETGITLTGTTNTEGAIVAITLVKIAQAMREM